MILVATGLRREARLIAGQDLSVVAGGGDAARLERELEAAAPSASGIISMGLCGALADGLKPGDWVVGSDVIALNPGRGEERRFETDPAWSDALATRLGKPRFGPILGARAIIAEAARKRAARRATSALAVDMESHIAAAVAARHGLAFAVARVVSDGAARSLPKAAQAGMAPDGRMDLFAVLWALAKRPQDLPALIRVGTEAERAFRTLARGRDLLGPRLGRPDVDEFAFHMV